MYRLAFLADGLSGSSCGHNSRLVAILRPVSLFSASAEHQAAIGVGGGARCPGSGAASGGASCGGAAGGRRSRRKWCT